MMANVLKPYQTPRLTVLGALRVRTQSNTGTLGGDSGTMMR